MTRPRLIDEVRIAVWPDGRCVAIVDPKIPDSAPTDIKEGLARRRLANEGHPCPCGAQARIIQPNRAARRAGARTVGHAVIEHEPDCPASDTTLVPRLRAWLGINP